MKRYEQGSVGMRPDPEGLWCDYTEAQAEIERLRGLLRECLEWVEFKDNGGLRYAHGAPELVKRIYKALEEC